MNRLRIVTFAASTLLTGPLLLSGCSNHPLDRFLERSEQRSMNFDRKWERWSEKQDRKAQEGFDRIMGKDRAEFEF